LVRRLGDGLALTQFVLVGMVVLFVLSLLLSPSALELRLDPFRLLSPRLETLYLLGASGAVPVFGLGRWWTVLSASWLHGGLLHLLFNLAWAYQLLPLASRIYGPGRMLLLWWGSGATGFFATSVAGAWLPPVPLLGGGGSFSIGASGAVFGILSALWLYGRQSGQLAMRRQLGAWMAVAFVFGVLLPGVDNWAHVGGSIGGLLLARLLRPLEPERLDHLVAGGALLLASLGAVAWSVWDGFTGS
jgi:rhomboid protease GluP